MRAVVCTQYGPPEALAMGELPLPIAGKEQVGVQVAAAGVAFADTLMIRNLHQNKHALPFAPGMEVAGTVAADAGPWRAGQRVMALVFDGGHATNAVARIDDVFALPDSVGFPLAAALGSIHLTAHAALRWKARVEPGDTVLVLGAGSGVGLAAVGIGKALGARVIAAASSEAKLAAARAQGADELVDYAAGLSRDRILALTGGAGVDIVVDPVGGAMHEAALASLAWDGRYLILGFAAGGIPQLAANRLLVKNRSALGFVLMFYRQRRPELLRQSWDELMAMLADGRLRPEIPVPLPLDHGPAAMRALMDRAVTGRIALDPNR